MKNLILFIVLFGIHKCFPQSTLTIREVYDFEIGNEFHYEHNTHGLAPTPLFKNVISNKYWSINNDTVFYKINTTHYVPHIVYTPSYHLEYNITFSFDSVKYTNLDSSILTTINIFNINPEFDTILQTTDSLCTRIINHFEHIQGFFEPIFRNYSFGKGLGQTFYSIQELPSSTTYEEWTLDYYKKNADSCGNPINILKDNILYANDDEVKIYPSYIQNKILNIELLEHKNCDLFIIDLSGKVIIKQSINKSQNEINLMKINKGFYFVKLKFKDRILVKKIIIE